MNKQTIIARLMELPELIANAEIALINAQNNLNIARSQLTHREDGLYLGVFEDEGMVIDGKNAEIRSAQLRKFSAIERNEVARTEHLTMESRYKLDKLKTELKALQSIVDLLKGAA
ncbi:hypothetical protein GC096_30470 [Paenibacillus sp. LMG 31461]|uniref:Phage protein n=1 Tax=Paenibacillus plantarum TaxID=2654975 RepID=A0ABX1XII1_9BACL|nr:hypothetical protein [Paenibacillus plantarum]NOU68355.1 hypothetical protein [Paenibacillus plantarum]